MRSISVLCEIKYTMCRIYYGRFAIENMIILDGQIWLHKRFKLHSLLNYVVIPQNVVSDD